MVWAEFYELSKFSAEKKNLSRKKWRFMMLFMILFMSYLVESYSKEALLRRTTELAAKKHIREDFGRFN